jgi:hypothetical protein
MGHSPCLLLTKLPKAEHDIVEWQTAMEALLLVAEHDGPTMFARIGVMRALNHIASQPRRPRHAASARGAYRIIR